MLQCRYREDERMHFVKILIGLSVVVQVYYLYEFVYSIPMRRGGGFLRGYANNKPVNYPVVRLIDRFHEKRTQKPLQQ